MTTHPFVRLATFALSLPLISLSFVLWMVPAHDVEGVTKTMLHSDGSLFVEQTVSGDTHWVGKGMKWKEGEGDKSITLNGITIHPVGFIDQETTTIRGQLTGEQMDRIDQMGYDFQDEVDNSGGFWVNPDNIKSGDSEGSALSEPANDSVMSADVAANDVQSGETWQPPHDEISMFEYTLPLKLLATLILICIIILFLMSLTHV